MLFTCRPLTSPPSTCPSSSSRSSCPSTSPRIDLPSINVPDVDLRDVDVPSAEQIIEWFRDAVYAGTGLVALTAERVADLQKQLVELVKAQLKR